jgi:hypothetical protein
MVEERIKQFTGNPSPIEIVIEIMGLGDLDPENKGLSASKNVLHLLYRLKREYLAGPVGSCRKNFKIWT